MNIGIILARAGSKRIKNKNIKNFFGKPIIYYSIKIAIKSKLFNKVYVSTDSEKIKKIAVKYGAIVNNLRPKKYSSDNSSTQSVIRYEIKNLEKIIKKKNFNICCIYATAPLLKIHNLKQGLRLLNERKNLFVFPAVKFSKSVQRAFVENSEKVVSFLMPKFRFCISQKLNNCYYDTGQFYWATAKTWLKKPFLHSSKIIEIYQDQAQDLDNIDDWVKLKKKFRNEKKKNFNSWF
jgi:N-acylneuraminate cytidylyltransferase